MVEQGISLFASGAAPTGRAQLYDIEIVDKVISDCTGSGRHKLVSGAGTTLLLSLQHPTVAVRQMGVQVLQDTMAAAGDGDKEQAELIADCLQVLLADDDEAVLQSIEVTSFASVRKHSCSAASAA